MNEADLVEIAPNRWRFVRPSLPPARSALPCPFVISDTIEPTEQVDGKFYTSKARFRAVGRALGLTEVGTEKPKPKQRTHSDPVKRRRTFERAIAQYKQGRRAREVRSAK
jgi:hypothetical protein